MNAQASKFRVNHVMLRIKDPARSLPFYQDILGLKLLRQFEFKEMKFTLYFLGYAGRDTAQGKSEVSIEHLTNQSGLIELTHNHGTESDPSFQGYHNGNSDPRGFGHIGLSVPDVQQMCETLQARGVEFVKRPDEGTMKEVAFIKDPDGYWIEILSVRSFQEVMIEQQADGRLRRSS